MCDLSRFGFVIVAAADTVAAVTAAHAVTSAAAVVVVIIIIVIIERDVCSSVCFQYDSNIYINSTAAASVYAVLAGL